jgi:hypothetical protein
MCEDKGWAWPQICLSEERAKRCLWHKPKRVSEAKLGKWLATRKTNHDLNICKKGHGLFPGSRFSNGSIDIVCGWSQQMSKGHAVNTVHTQLKWFVLSTLSSKTKLSSDSQKLNHPKWIIGQGIVGTEGGDECVSSLFTLNILSLDFRL